MDWWLTASGTDPDLSHCITSIAWSRGGETMTDICCPSQKFWELAKTLDAIGWRQFLEGMITTKMVEAQDRYQRCVGERLL